MMMRSFARITIVVLIAAMWPAAAMAQDVPFSGVVVQDGVKIRAGAGRAYYVVGELKKGTIVNVDEVIFGWNKIVSPAGVHSYISKMYVDAKGNGDVGYVNTDRVEVKAGSIKGPGESYRGQVQLNRGDSVDILQEEGSFYRITPPKGAYVFLPPGSVRRADPSQLAEAQGDASQAAAESDAASDAADSADSTDNENAPSSTAASSGSTDSGDSDATADADENAAAAEGAQASTEASTSDDADAAADDDAGSERSSTAAADAQDTNDDEQVAVEPRQPTLRESLTQQPAAARSTSPDSEEDAAADALDADAMAAANAADEGTDADGTTRWTNGQATDTAGDPSVAAMDKGGMQTAAVSDQLKQLEARMVPLFMQPLEEQPIQEMIQAYETVQRQNLPTIDRKIVGLRLAVLKRNQELASALTRLHDSAGQPTPVTLPDAVPAADPDGPVTYDAVGRLLASSVYDGVHLPRMFRVVDPSSGRTILWVEPGGPVDPKQYLGKVVGLVGPQQYDPTLKFNILDVNRIDLLEAPSVTP